MKGLTFVKDAPPETPPSADPESLSAASPTADSPFSVPVPSVSITPDAADASLLEWIVTDEDANENVSAGNHLIEKVPSFSVSLPAWVDTDERHNPEQFCAGIFGTSGKLVFGVGGTIMLSNAIHSVLLCLCFCVLALGIVGGKHLPMSDYLPTGTLLVISALISVPFLLLSWGLVTCVLKSIRATFCHQHVIEKHVRMQTRILEHCNEIMSNRML